MPKKRSVCLSAGGRRKMSQKAQDTVTKRKHFLFRDSYTVIKHKLEAANDEIYHRIF